MGRSSIKMAIESQGLSLMYVVGRGVSTDQIRTLRCYDPMTVQFVDAAMVNPTPDTEVPTPKICINFSEEQIIAYLHGQGDTLTKGQQKAISSQLEYALIGYRGEGALPYIIGYLPVERAGAGGTSRIDGDARRGVKELPTVRLCTGMDNPNFVGERDNVTKVVGADDLTLAVVSQRENGAVGITATNNIFQSVIAASVNYRDKAVFTFQQDVKKCEEPGCPPPTKYVDWEKRAYKRTQVISGSGYYRFSAGFDCNTWERALYGRRTVAYIARLAGQLRMLAGIVDAGLATTFENFKRISKWEAAIYDQDTQSTSNKTLNGLNDFGISNQALDKWIVGDNDLSKTIDSISHYSLSEPACDPTRIVPPLEQALCAEYIRMSDFGGLYQFRTDDVSGGVSDGLAFDGEEYLGGQLSPAKVVGDTDAAFGPISSGTKKTGNVSEGEVLSAYVTGTPRVVFGNDDKNDYHPRLLYMQTKTLPSNAREKFVKRGLGVPTSSGFSNNVQPTSVLLGNGSQATSSVIRDVKPHKGNGFDEKIGGTLSYQHYGNVEGHHGNPAEYRHGEAESVLTYNVWNFARGYFRSPKVL